MRRRLRSKSALLLLVGLLVSHVIMIEVSHNLFEASIDPFRYPTIG